MCPPTLRRSYGYDLLGRLSHFDDDMARLFQSAGLGEYKPRHSNGADSQRVLGVDNGSCMCKAGFAEDETPRAIFPSIVG